MLLTTLSDSSGCICDHISGPPPIPPILDCLALGHAALLPWLSVKLAAGSQESPALFSLRVIVWAAWTPSVLLREF